MHIPLTSSILLSLLTLSLTSAQDLPLSQPDALPTPTPTPSPSLPFSLPAEISERAEVVNPAISELRTTQYPTITTMFAPTVLANGVTTYVKVIYTQGFEPTPAPDTEGWTVEAGYVGLGTLTGGVAPAGMTARPENGVSKRFGGSGGTWEGLWMVIAGVGLGVFGGGLLLL